MVDLKILDKQGVNTARLRDIFTCTDASKPDHKIKEKLCESIESRVSEGVTWCARHAKLYQAVDLAWDSTPIQKETLPLMLYAQGKIDLQQFRKELDTLTIAKDFIKEGEKGEIKLDMPRLFEVSFNLVRSYVTRRVAAQSARFSNLWPYFRYEPRSTTAVGKLRGEVLSQRIDIMADQYNYRHLGEQCIRDMFLYSHSVAFPTCAWDREVQWVDNNGELRAHVVREGVDWVNPHPTRVFWDRSAPLANVNCNNGPQWIGYWDLVRYSSIKDVMGYFNIDAIKFSDKTASLIGNYPAFFNYYFDPTVLDFPDTSYAASSNNDRSHQGTLYTTDECDKGLLLTNVFMRVNPKRLGIGDYPFDVWMRVVVASDNTVVYGEFMPSLPAAYGGLNEHDGRVVNPSFAMELMPFQDQCTNILSQLLLTMKQGLFQIWAIDEDSITKEVKDALKAGAKGQNYYVEPAQLYYSAARLRELGITIDQAVKVIQANIQNNIIQSFDALLKLLHIVDRLAILSPNEIGQPAPREISAREVTEMATTTDTVYSFVSNGVDEQRNAMKQVSYESLVVCSTADIIVPVINRFTRKTIELAGFKVVDEGDDVDLIDRPKAHTVTGASRDLVYPYLFSSRDGAERSSNPQAANVLVQLAAQVVGNPMIAEKLGVERVFDLYNEIFRLSGAAYDLKLEMGDGQSDEFSNDKMTQLEARVKQLEALLSQMGAMPQGAPQGMPPQGTGAPPI